MLLPIYDRLVASIQDFKEQRKKLKRNIAEHQQQLRMYLQDPPEPPNPNSIDLTEQYNNNILARAKKDLFWLGVKITVYTTLFAICIICIALVVLWSAVDSAGKLYNFFSQ